MGKLPKILLIIFIIIITLITLILILWNFWGKDQIETNNFEKLVDAEVINWNPENAELRLAIEKNGTRLKTTLILQIPNSFVRIPYKTGDNNTQISRATLSGKEDQRWTTAFCAGDKVKLATGKVNLQIAKIPDKLNWEPYKIKNLGPRECMGK